MTPTIIGIDAALRTLHVAIVQDAALLSVVQHDLGASPASRIGVLTRLTMGWAGEYGPCAVYLERPWLNHYTNRGGETKANVSTALALAQLVGNIEGLAVAAGHRVVQVDPSTWRASVMLDGVSRRRADVKAAAVRTVQLTYGRTLGHDAADAVLIGVYGAAAERRAQLVGAAAS